MVAPAGNHPPKGTDELLLGAFDLAGDGGFLPFGMTRTWCWQQGCMLRWLPPDEMDFVIYNDVVEGVFGAVVRHAGTGHVHRTYTRPIYCVDKMGAFGLSLNFSRLHRLRPGYGYVGVPDETTLQDAPADDGVWHVALATGSEELLLPINRLAAIEPQPTMVRAQHYLNCLTYNPSGTRFAFLHRWVRSGVLRTRVLTCGSDGHDLYLLANIEFASHFTWKSDSQLLVYSRHDDTGARFHLYTDLSQYRVVVGEGTLIRDGHPSYSPDGRALLLDTYPDEFGERQLFFFTGDGTLVPHAHLHSPAHYDGEVRCDLHPRWNRDGQQVCFDSAHTGTRSLYITDVPEAVRPVAAERPSVGTGLT
jgi:hypothetical protein